MAINEKSKRNDERFAFLVVKFESFAVKSFRMDPVFGRVKC